MQINIKVRYLDVETVNKLDELAKNENTSRQKYLKRKLEELADIEFEKINKFTTIFLRCFSISCLFIDFFKFKLTKGEKLINLSINNFREAYIK